MREDKFYELFGDIDPEIIAAADKPVPFRKKHGWKVILIAATLAFAIALAPIAGAFALAAGYKITHPGYQGNYVDALNQMIENFDSAATDPDREYGGLLNSGLLDVDWGALADTVSPDGNVDWDAFFAILQGEQPIDPSTSAFKAEFLSDGTAKIVAYNGNEENVTVPEKIAGKFVTVIGEGAFSEHPEIRSVSLPETATTIEPYAFCACTGLESVRIPKQLRVIEDYAFAKCFSLDQLIMENFSSKAYGAFLPDSLHTLGSHAFEYCRKLTFVAIPSSLQNWGAYAFSGSGLEQILFEDAIKEIPDFAFAGCEQLPKVVVPSSVTRIGNAAFFGCTKLESVTLNEGLEYLDACCFDSTAIASITIPSTVISFEEGMFYDCPNLEAVVFAGNAPEIFTRPGTPEQDRNRIADYTVYYLLGADGFGRSEWNGHNCEMMEVLTEQYVKKLGKSTIPMYNVEILGQLNLWESEDEVTVIESYDQYKQYAAVLNSTRYDPEYFRQYAIVLVRVKHTSTEQVLGVGGIAASLYTVGGLWYLALYPVVTMDTPKANTNDELYTFIAIDVKRSDIRTDNVIREGEVFAYSVSDFASGGSVYHESYKEIKKK